METNFKGTLGGAKFVQTTNHPTEENETVSFVQLKKACIDIGHVSQFISMEEAEANANLIADAFNVRQQINVDLPELLEQRNELLDKVKYLTRALEAVYSMGASKPIIQGAKDLITKIEQK